jgi:hypothetical protein
LSNEGVTFSNARIAAFEIDYIVRLISAANGSIKNPNGFIGQLTRVRRDFFPAFGVPKITKQSCQLVGTINDLKR